MDARFRHLVIGLVLGLFAFTGYLIEHNIAHGLAISFSHGAIFLAAVTAGPEAALIAFTTASFASTLFDEGSFRHIVQAAVLTGCLLVHRRWFDRFPHSFAIVLGWACLLLPAYVMLPIPATQFDIHNRHLFSAQPLIDLFLGSLAASTLFLTWVCESILEKPYQPNRSRLVTAASNVLLSGIACGSVLLAQLQLSERNALPRALDMSEYVLLALAIATLSWWLGRSVDAFLEKLSPHEQLSRLSGTFQVGDVENASPFAPRHRFPPPLPPDELGELPSIAITPPGVCAVERDGAILFANARFLELVQSSETTLSKQNLKSCVMENQIRAACLESLDRFYQNPTKLSGEIRLNALPDKLKFLSLSIEPHQFEAERTGALITLQDITDRRTIEYHLLEAQKMKNIGSVIGGIAHAFNNSLTAIVGQASFALRVQDSQTQENALREILEQAQKAGDLVWKLLDFSQGKPGAFQTLSLPALLNSKLHFLRKLLGERYELSFTNTASSELHLKGDANLLLQALTELITNAKDSYREKHGKIEIELTEEHFDEDISRLHPGARGGQYTRLIIRDTGCGMSNEMLAHAFAPLVSTKLGRGHSGLGLSIVYAIVRAHDGFLNVESFPERGTTVSLYFPVVEPEDSPELPAESLAPKASDKEPRLPKQKSHSILVVEDEPEIRTVVGRMLEVLGYQVKTCGSAEEASSIAAKSSFDLVLVDYVMPSMSGLDLISSLSRGQKKSHTKFLLMSGCGMTHLPNSDVQQLTKPFDIEALSEAVSRSLLSSSISSDKSLN